MTHFEMMKLGAKTVEIKVKLRDMLKDATVALVAVLSTREAAFM